MIKERIKYIENKISSIRERKEQNKHLFKETDLIAHSVELNRLKDELKWLNKLEIMTKTVTYDDTRDISIRVIEALIKLGHLQDNDDHYFEIQDTIHNEINEVFGLDIDDNFEITVQ